MENEEIIKLALKLTEENNSLYKKAARNQAFMIKAEDSLGTVDTFITVEGLQNADAWKKQFETAGFGNVVVTPFRTSGNLNFNDVDSNFFNEISKRSKWQMTHSPKGLNTPFTPYNPYAGSNVGFDATDSRLAPGSHSVNGGNKYQEYISQKLKSDEDKVFAGWFDGSLEDWVKKIESLSDNVRDALKVEYANLHSSPQLTQYFDQVRRRNPEYNLKVYKPENYDIKYYKIDMTELGDILQLSSVDLDDYPEELILPVLDSIIETARKHKLHKQYKQEDMDKFQQDEIDDQLSKDVKTWNIIKKVLRGVSR
jgi:hypothetical protein